MKVGTRVRKTTDANEYDRIPKGALGTVEETFGGRAFDEANPTCRSSPAIMADHVWVIWDSEDRCFMEPQCLAVVGMCCALNCDQPLSHPALPLCDGHMKDEELVKAWMEL